MEGTSRRSSRVASLPLQFRQASQGAEIRTGGPDTRHAGRIGLQTTQLQGGIRGGARENSFCDRFHRRNGRVTWSQRAENGSVTTVNGGRTMRSLNSVNPFHDPNDAGGHCPASIKLQDVSQAGQSPFHFCEIGGRASILRAG